MNYKVPHSPFSTRLSGSAKETELRIRNIFQWKKKRPPVPLFILTAVLVLSCFSLVSCQTQETPSPNDEPLDPGKTEIPPFSSVEFFNSYVTDFSEYTYTGKHSATFDDRTITTEDIPENFAEEMTLNNYWLPAAGDFEPLIAMMGEESLLISAKNEQKRSANGSYFTDVAIHTLSTLTPQDFGTTGVYFSDGTVADRFLKELWTAVQEHGLTEYTVTYADLSWKLSEIAKEGGPQLGDGRYERLFLMGQTESDPVWKMYELFWGDYTLNRILPDFESANDSAWQGDPILFPDGELTILLPESWKGKVGYERGNDELSFYHLATSAEIGSVGAGQLYHLEYLAGQFYPLNHSFPWPGGVIATTSGGSYVYYMPSDVQFVPETEEEYTDLFQRAGDIQFILSDELLENSINQYNPDNPAFAAVTREGRTMVLTADADMTNCYSYSYDDPEDTSAYCWFQTENHELKKGDIVLVLEESDGMSRVVIPYGDIPWRYGFVDSSLLSNDKVTIRQVNQAIIAYEVASYSAPGGTGNPTTLYPCRVEILEIQNGWAHVQPLGTGGASCWVDSSHLYYGFADDAVIDAPPALTITQFPS